MKRKFILLFLVFFTVCIFFNTQTAKASDISDEVDSQLENLDLSELEEYYSSISGTDEGIVALIKKMVDGQFDFSFVSIIDVIFGKFISEIKNFIAPFLTVIGIVIFLAIIGSLKGAFLDEGLTDIIFIACYSTVVIIIFSMTASIFINVKNSIENLSKLSEIMSPIIITLMVATGANSSAAIFKPTVAFLSGGIISVILHVVLPLISAMFAFNVLSYFSKEIKLKKFTSFFGSVIKWVIGIIVTVYSVFLTVQGIGGAIYDGISVKAAKYLISNSVPLIGGFLKDGLDLVVIGSVLIKNSVGIAVIIALFYTIISPAIVIAAFSLLLNFTASVTETISSEGISDFCTSTAKCFNYLLVAILMVGMSFFVTVLLMIISANGVI